MNNFLIYVKSTDFIKVASITIFSLLFIKIFMYGDVTKPNWSEKYSIFSVNANKLPGGDARNIKSAAACRNHSNSYFSTGDCTQQEIDILNKLYPSNKAFNTPPYNYPPIWADIYSFFEDNSEEFFLKFWKLNGYALLITVLILSIKFNYKIFPLIIFSPVTLLAIERGNIDALVFGLLFLPITIFSSKYIISFFIALTAALKIYPVFAYTYLLFYNRKEILRSFLIIIPIIPLGLYSLWYIPEYIGKTSYGASASFGAFSLLELNFLQYKSYIFYLAFLIFYPIFGISIYFSKSIFHAELSNDLNKSTAKEIALLFTSLSIITLLFIVFTSWAYRFIFIIPSLFILTDHKNLLSKFLLLGLLLTLWVPILPYGLFLFNLMFYLLIPIMLTMLIYIFKYYMAAKEHSEHDI